MNAVESTVNDKGSINELCNILKHETSNQSGCNDGTGFRLLCMKIIQDIIYNEHFFLVCTRTTYGRNIKR